MRRVRPEDKHITRIRGLLETIVKCGHFSGNTLVRLKVLPNNIKAMQKIEEHSLKQK
jgi:hypothetical protein